MDVLFETEELEYLYISPLDAIRGKQKFPVEVIKQYKKKLQLLISLPKLQELRNFKGLHFEYLKGGQAGTMFYTIERPVPFNFHPY